jgi:putative restriction endonuclease
MDRVVKMRHATVDRASNAVRARKPVLRARADLYRASDARRSGGLVENVRRADVFRQTGPGRPFSRRRSPGWTICPFAPDTWPVEDEHDRLLRAAAFDRIRDLSRRYDDLVPLDALKQGFTFGGTRVSFGSFFSGIYRPKEMHGPAALALVTAPPKAGKPAPYEDTFDATAGTFSYRFRDPASSSPRARGQAEADNVKLIEAHRRGVPVVHFRGIAAGQYTPLAPVFVTAIDVHARTASLVVGLPMIDTTSAGLISDEITRRYATREAAYRLHQHHFRRAVLRAYRTRCTICELKEATLLQAAHIIEDRDPLGGATVVNGLALCAIHHLAYDRNLVGIDPDGLVHIHGRLLDEIDGPMLKNGLQHFHGAHILQPQRPEDRPDRQRLEIRFASFQSAA